MIYFYSSIDSRAKFVLESTFFQQQGLFRRQHTGSYSAGSKPS